MLQINQANKGDRVIVTAQHSPDRGARGEILDKTGSIFFVQLDTRKDKLLPFFPSELERENPSSPTSVPINSSEFRNSPQAKANEASWYMKKKRRRK